MTIYDVLGREAGIRTAVDDFYERVLADDRLVGYFEGVAMPRLRAHQVALLCAVTGGPESYTGRSLDVAHDHLGVTPEHFDLVVGHLDDTLSGAGVEADVRGQIAGALGEHRDAIVSEVSTGS